MEGWQFAEFFIECGVSGSLSLADRSEGQRMLSVLQPGDIVIASLLQNSINIEGRHDEEPKKALASFNRTADTPWEWVGQS